MEQISVKIEELEEDRRNSKGAYLHYSIAKAYGLKRGDVFGLIGGKEVFEVVEYVNFRNDINRSYSGFHCVQK